LKTLNCNNPAAHRPIMTTFGVQMCYGRADGRVFTTGTANRNTRKANGGRHFEF